MSSLSIIYRPDGVAVLTFDAPNSRANVLSDAVWTELRSALRTLRVREGVTGLVMASAKPDVFIAGADLKFFAAVPEPEHSSVRELVALGLETLDLLESLPFPTCAVINGAALGGGLEVALGCDVRVCGPNPAVQLGLPEVKLGLIPGWGGSQRLPRVCDLKSAGRMLLTGESVSASDAVASKLVDHIFHDGDLIEHAVGFVKGVNPEPPRRAKREPLPLVDQELLKEEVLTLGPPDTAAGRELAAVLVRGGEQPLADALLIETAAFGRLAGSDESRRRIADFFTSRKKG
jgi:enoyl-CoA hydratase/carnithine racemase